MNLSVYKCKRPGCGMSWIPEARSGCPGCGDPAELDSPVEKWHRRLLQLAQTIASWSKDPSTKVGAVAVDRPSRAILETGYNGLPRGVEDLPDRMERPQKYLWTGHAEENLVANAARGRLEGAEVFVTHLCCSRCARLLINSGVKSIVVDRLGKTSMPEEEFTVAKQMLAEAGVSLTYV